MKQNKLMWGGALIGGGVAMWAALFGPGVANAELRFAYVVVAILAVVLPLLVLTVEIAEAP